MAGQNPAFSFTMTHNTYYNLPNLLFIAPTWTRRCGTIWSLRLADHRAIRFPAG